MADAGEVAVIGAGIAGLACAGALRDAGHAVRVFDKGRGPGGRASTKRVAVPGGEVAFDHGAQYLTARDPAFAGELRRWEALGLAAPWPAAGEGAWIGTPGMSAPLAALARALDVRWDARVDAIEPNGDTDGWRLQLGGEDVGPFAAVALALPAEQTATMAARIDPGLHALAAWPSDPCWTVMLAFGERLPVAADVVRSDGDLGWAARNSAKPGRGPTEAWVLQASPDWSRAHLEDEAETVVAALSALFARDLGIVLLAPIVARAHRWRYARSARRDEGSYWDQAMRLGACGDWLIGPRFESAWLSGHRLGLAMTDR